MAHTDWYNINWHLLQAGFKVLSQADGNGKVATDCRADAPLEHAGGARRLLEITGAGNEAWWRLAAQGWQPQACCLLSGGALLHYYTPSTPHHANPPCAGLAPADGIHKTSKLDGRNFTIGLPAGSVVAEQRGTIERYCSLNTSGTHVGREGGSEAGRSVMQPGGAVCTGWPGPQGQSLHAARLRLFRLLRTHPSACLPACS